MTIYNDDQYKNYLHEIDTLMKQDPDISSPEGERLSLLALAIKEYETKHFFFDKPTPIEAIRFRMDEQGLRQNDLVPYIGSKSKVSEILSGKRNLTVSMIRALNKSLEIPLDILIQEPKTDFYNMQPESINWKTVPYREINKRGWFKIKEEDDEYKKKIVVTKFLENSHAKGVSWRRTHNHNKVDSNYVALMLWITKVTLIAKEVSVGGFDKNLITTDYLRKLAQLSQFEQGPLLAKEMLANNGIKLVFLKQLSKTKIDGACFLDKDGKPIIGMSLRHDRIDNFWFTLLHEMSHVYKHLNNQNQFIDDLEEDSQDPQEKEADKIARESLVPRSAWTKSNAFSQRTKANIYALAKQLNVHTAIVAGFIRYESNDYTKFNEILGKNEISSLLRDQIHE